MRKFTTLVFILLASFLPRFVKAQMEFVENKGQWDAKVKYRGDFNTGSFFLEDKGFTVLLHNADDIKHLSETVHGHGITDSTQKKHAVPTPPPNKLVVNSFAYKVRFLGALGKAAQVPDKRVGDSYNNYFIGSDPSKWSSNCRIFGAVSYQEIYPNIDIRYYSDGTGRLKYDFIVKPGGNPDYIAMEYSGPKLSVKEKELVISTPVGDVRELYPYTYQSSTGKNQEVDCKYVVKGNIVTFKVGQYDPKATLIIDPSIICLFFYRKQRR